jgi:hypothetical protein
MVNDTTEVPKNRLINVGAIVLKGKNITLDGSGKINVKAAGDVVIKGSKIGQN